MVANERDWHRRSRGPAAALALIAKGALVVALAMMAASCGGSGSAGRGDAATLGTPIGVLLYFKTPGMPVTIDSASYELGTLYFTYADAFAYDGGTVMGADLTNGETDDNVDLSSPDYVPVFAMRPGPDVLQLMGYFYSQGKTDPVNAWIIGDLTVSGQAARLYAPLDSSQSFEQITSVGANAGEADNVDVFRTDNPDQTEIDAIRNGAAPDPTLSPSTIPRQLLGHLCVVVEHDGEQPEPPPDCSTTN